MLIRVFLGSRGGLNVAPFENSSDDIIGKQRNRIIVESLDTDESKKRSLSPD